MKSIKRRVTQLETKIRVKEEPLLVFVMSFTRNSYANHLKCIVSKEKEKNWDFCSEFIKAKVLGSLANEHGIRIVHPPCHKCKEIAE